MANIFRVGLSGQGKSKDKVPVLGEDFTYTGSCEVIDDSDEVSGVQWRIKFYTSGTLVFAKKQTVDLFLVGGGGNGGAYSSPSSGGGGGGGGYTGTFKQLTIEAQQNYSIVVGGSAGASSALGQSVNGGNSAFNTSGGANGGSGGGGGGGTSNYNGGNGGSDGSNGVSAYGNSGTGQGTTTREFGETGATLYAGGGGGAGDQSGTVGAGGDGGGGAGGAYGSTATSGAANTGGGGGGIRDTKNNGAGGSGIAIIRKARTTAALKVNAPTGSTVTAELNGKVTQLYESGGYSPVTWTSSAPTL